MDPLDIAFVAGQTAYTAGAAAILYDRATGGNRLRAINNRIGESMSRYNLRKRESGRVVTPDRRAKKPRTLFATRAPVANAIAPTLAPTMRNNVIHQSHRSTRRTHNYGTLGRKPGRFATRRVKAGEANTTAASVVRDKEVQITELVFIEKAGSAEEDIINKRRGMLVHVKGVKFRCIMRLNQDISLDNVVMAVPIRVRWAIVIPKANKILTETITPGHPRAVLPEFLVDPNPSEKMAMTWTNTGIHFDLFNRKINREQYGVVKEGQFVLNTDDGIGNTGTRVSVPMKSVATLNLWIPIKRQMVFSNDGSGSPDANLYFVWWYARDNDLSAAQKWAADADKPIQECHEKITYFTNSAMYK